MSTHAARYGPRIGGVRRPMRQEITEPRYCDWPADVYLVTITASHGSSAERFNVLAYDDAQAHEFARLRYPNIGDGTVTIEWVGPAKTHKDLALGVVLVETPEEASERHMRWLGL